MANFAHPEYPELEDFGDMLLRGDRGTGYVRVDWFTPDGLDSWGDGRLTILGTDGFIEIRKNIDIGGRPGGNHLFLVDGSRRATSIASDVELPFGPQLLDDVRNRTETAMPQAHAFLASELALRAQLQAQQRRRRRRSRYDDRASATARRGGGRWASARSHVRGYQAVPDRFEVVARVRHRRRARAGRSPRSTASRAW